jgi:hypothetical protein
VEVGPARLEHRDRERLVTVGDGQVRGGAGVLGQGAEHRQRGVPQGGLNPPAVVQHRESEPGLALTVAAHQPVQLEGVHQPVDDGPADSE